MKNNDKKNFIWNLVGTTLNAFNSFFFMIIVMRVMGSEQAGIFTTTFSLACLFCIIGTYYGRVFHVTDISNKYTNKEYIVHRFITCFIMILITIIYAFAKGYNNYKFMILLLLSLYKCNEAISEIFFGIMQRNDKLYLVGQSLTIKSICSLLVFAITLYFSKNLILSCFLINILWLFTILFIDAKKAKQYISNKEKVNNKNIINLFIIGFSTFAFLFLSVYVASLPKYLVDGQMANDLQAVFGIIMMPATIITLLAQYLISPFVKTISDYHKKNDKDKFNRVVLKIVLGIFILGLIIIVAMKLIGINILSWIYNIDLSVYSLDIMIILVGAIMYGMSNAFSTALIALRYNFIQLINYIICAILGSIITLLLINKTGIFGASIGYLITMFIQFVIYIISYFIIMKKTKEWKDNEKL